MDFYEFLRELENSVNETIEKMPKDKKPNTNIKTARTIDNDNIINTARIMLEYHVPVELICQSLHISEDFITANGLIKPKTRTFHFPVEIATITEHTEEIEASSIEEAKMLLLKKIDEYNDKYKLYRTRKNKIQSTKEENVIQRGTEFLPTYIQMLIKYSGGYGFENLKSR